MVKFFVVTTAFMITGLLLFLLRLMVRRRRDKGEVVTYWEWIERIGWVVGIFGVLFAVTTVVFPNPGSDTSPPVSDNTEQLSPVKSSPPANAGRAPWDGPQLKEGEVPSILLEEWRRAKNRHACAPIAPQSLGDGAGVQARRASFIGGWGITYEHTRGSFTIAGTGEPAHGGVDGADPWPYHIRWDDRSIVGYGTEGGQYVDGPDATAYLAYLIIPGQDCLYNIKTKQGKRHLEYLLSQLRLVNVPE